MLVLNSVLYFSEVLLQLLPQLTLSAGLYGRQRQIIMQIL